MDINYLTLYGVIVAAILTCYLIRCIINFSHNR